MSDAFSERSVLKKTTPPNEFSAKIAPQTKGNPALFLRIPMFKKLHYKVRGLPTPLAGLALGIASLGWCLENALPLAGWGQTTGAVIGLVMIGFLVLKADSGEFKTSGKLFDRQATVALSSDFGTLTMGRVGGIGSGAGFDLVYGYADAFDGGSGSVLGLAKSDRYDNMITYQTPKFAGMQATVQYSFNESSTDKDREGSSAVNRYASAGLTGSFGALNTVLAYEFQNYQSFGKDARGEDGHIVYLGGNYDCGFAKTFVMAQYFKGLKAGSINGLGMLDDIEDEQTGTTLEDEFDAFFDKGAKGFGLHLGTIVPISNGDLTVGAYYVDGKGETSAAGEEDLDFDYIGLATKYEYRLSKRTSVYLGAGYHKAKAEDSEGEIEQKIGEVFTGLTHAF